MAIRRSRGQQPADLRCACEASERSRRGADPVGRIGRRRPLLDPVRPRALAFDLDVQWRDLLAGKVHGEQQEATSVSLSLRTRSAEPRCRHHWRRCWRAAPASQAPNPAWSCPVRCRRGWRCRGAGPSGCGSWSRRRRRTRMARTVASAAMDRPGANGTWLFLGAAYRWGTYRAGLNVG